MPIKKTKYYLDTVPMSTSKEKMLKLLADAYQAVRDKSNEVFRLQQEISALKSREVVTRDPCERCGADDNIWDVFRSLDRDGALTTPPAAIMTMVSRRCESCGSVQSLGPSCVTPEVEIEIRAAELSDLAASHATSSESRGWNDYASDASPPYMFDTIDGDRLHTMWLAGWLGRAIRDHH